MAWPVALFFPERYHKPSAPLPDNYSKYEEGAATAIRDGRRVNEKVREDEEGAAAGGGLDLHLRNVLEDKDEVWKGALCVLAYMAVGVVTYSFGLEGWGVADSLYFSMVTFTTVGYGDVVPVTQLGRLFTIFYAISGIAIIGSIIGKIGERVADAQARAMEDVDKQLEDETMDLVRGGEDNGGSSRLLSLKRSLRSAAPPIPKGAFRTIWLPHLPLIVPFLIGAYVEGRDQEWTFVDLLYYATCTVTTVGYGDLAPDDPVSRTVAVLFVPMSACALASILGRYAALAAERRVVEAQRSVVRRGLRLSDLDVMDKDGDGEVSKLEFFEFMLLSMDRVDRAFLERLHAQFDELDADGSGTLDKRDLVAKIQKVSKGEESRGEGQSPPKPQDDDGDDRNNNESTSSSYESPTVV